MRALRRWVLAATALVISAVIGVVAWSSPEASGTEVPAAISLPSVGTPGAPPTGGNTTGDAHAGGSPAAGAPALPPAPRRIDSDDGDEGFDDDGNEDDSEDQGDGEHDD